MKTRIKGLKKSAIDRKKKPKHRSLMHRAIADLMAASIPCGQCKRPPRDHIWRCMDCGDPLAKDSEGLPIFEHGMMAELCCPPDPKLTN